MIRRAIALIAFIGSAAGCAPNRPTAFVNALAAGDRAHFAGREREAATEYDEAAQATGRPIDRDEAMFRAALAYRHSGDTAAALERLDWLSSHSDAEIRGDRATFEAARTRFDTGDGARAEHDLEGLIVRSPDSGSARRGVDLVLAYRDQQDPSGASALAWIDSFEPRVRRRDLEPAFRWFRARRLEAAGRFDDAIRAYESLLEIPYPRNMHWDDGGFAYAQRLRSLHRPGDALAVIDRTLAVREIAVMRPGSDERPRYQGLGLLRGEILRDDLHDASRAADAYHRFYVEFPDSNYRDDALWSELELRDGLGQRDQSCGLATTLGRDFPCTRFGRRGAERARDCGHPVGDEVAARCHPHRIDSRAP